MSDATAPVAATEISDSVSAVESPTAPVPTPPSVTDRRSQLVELFVLAVGLPAAMAYVDELVLGRCVAEMWHGLPVYLTYAMLVLQVTLLGSLVGKRIQRPHIKWSVFLWAIVLIDMLVFSITAVDTEATRMTRCLAFAFMSGQVGLLTVWGILSPVFWAVRLPMAALGLALVTSFAASFSGGSDLWFAILCWQSLATAILCGILWFFGFRVRRLRRDQPTDRRLQFSMRHLFAWTTTVACVVGVVRLIDVASFLLLGSDSLLACIGLGGCFAIVSMVAVWSALGAERLLIRLIGLTVSMPVIALSIGAVGLSRIPAWISESLFLGSVYNPVLWFTWTCLATFFLAGLLAIFRTSGYRLLRIAASTNT